MEVFFYGLFMDQKILKANGIHASNPREAYLQDYTLKIGKRASLIYSPGDKAYGLLMSVEQEALDSLYAEPSVADYIPEKVNVVNADDVLIPARCYNLPLELLSGTNTSYAKSLYTLASDLNFPKIYLDKILSMTK